MIGMAAECMENTWGAPARPPTRRCIDACPEVRREAEEACRMRALIARMLDHLPSDSPLVDEARAIIG